MSIFRSAPLLLAVVLLLTPTALFARTPVEATRGSIQVTAPNGGEKWELGVTNSVTWSPYGYNPDVNPSKDVSAYLETRNDKGTFTTLGRVEESGKASIHWITGDLNSQNGTYSQVPPGSYYVRVVNNKTKATDRSDAPFTILPRPVDVKVDGSDGPVTLTNNQKVRVTWSSTGGRTTCELSGVRKTKNGNNYIENLPASGTLVGYAAVMSGYTSNAIDVGCRKGTDSSTTVYDVVAITVGNTPVTSSVQVVSPNGGEKIDPTKQMNVQFTPVGIKSYSLALYKNDQFKYWITKDQTAAGDRTTQGWYPSKALEGLGEGDNAGAIFKIYVTAQKADGTGYVDDKSDKPFSFVRSIATTTPPTPAKPLITFTSSQGGSPSSPTTALTWVVANATRCYLSYGNTQTEVPFIGTQVVYPEQTTVYTLRCGNEQGGKDGPVAEQKVTVTVKNPTAPPTCTLTTGKTVYAPGEEVTFTWTSTGATYGAWVLNGDAKALKLSGDKLSDNDTLTTSMGTTSSRFIVTLNVFSKTGVKGMCRVQLSNPAPVPALTDRKPLSASAYAAVAKQLEDLLTQLRALSGR